ncbi:phosphohexomutase domain-containing protein [Halocatena pleomorpha]|uniref:Phosphomannomutase n=1 Tax=Halocatena pleomorpha TaxID=1785090 RepID=A0A3P3RC31_9EURY|nr:phosphomannomutase [Halocatena pleomorpha]RRJ31042.1 phosphomannomutase [Halocatena pleomorpha]
MSLFGTAGIRGDAQKSVTPSLALTVGQAVGQEATEVVIARDGRETGTALAGAVESGVTSGGARALRAGQLPTPALAYASRGRHGVMLTASHNPPPDNGIKLFVDGEEFDAEREARIEERVADGLRPVEWDAWGVTERFQALSTYRQAVVDYARAVGTDARSYADGETGATGIDLNGLTVVVDCANGMASLATPQVLRELGAHVVALNANVDGHFPGRPSKPTPVTLSDLREFVGGYDDPVVGIGHDGDADRIVIVDGTGAVVHEDTVLAILAEHYTHASDASDPVVVTTPNASDRIDERVKAVGGRTERVRLGYLHDGIAAVQADGGSVVFAGEPWKHIHPGFGSWIDGVTSAAVVSVLIATAAEKPDDPQVEGGRNGLAVLRDPITERPYRKENVACPDEHKRRAMERVPQRLSEQFPTATMNEEHGVRLAFDDGGWTLVRPSGTEPYIRVYAESTGVDELVDTVTTVVDRAVSDARN